jgi:oligopeptide/dipeptide ABC transporter ATP-binding protein
VSDALLTVEHLAIEVGGREVVTNVSFSASKGACIGLAGESGSGKTVTCRALTGLLGRVGGRIVRGSVRFGGRELASATPLDWRGLRGRQIGFVPQASMSSLDPIMRIGKQLEEAVRALDPPSEPTKRATELLEMVQMRDTATVLRRFPHELSGGMRQRVMIALALAGRPALLIADEPTTALDVTVQRGILELLDELKRDAGLAVILVTHNLALVTAFTDEVAIMYSGSVVEAGPSAVVLEAPLHPYTAALLAADPAAATERRLHAIPGNPATAEDRPDGCAFWPRCAFAIEGCEVAVPLLRPLDGPRRVACIRATELEVRDD